MPTMADVLVELKAIRELLEQQAQQQAVCPHGSTGFCMHCILPTFDAIEMSVRQAVQR